MVLPPVHDLDSHSLLGTLFFFVLNLLLPIITENILQEMPNSCRSIPIPYHPQFQSILAYVIAPCRQT